MVEMEGSGGGHGQWRRRCGFAGARNSGNSRERDAADAGGADAARGDERTLAAMPKIGGAAFLRDSGAAIRGGSQGVGAGGGLDWIHAAKMHRPPAPATRCFRFPLMPPSRSKVSDAELAIELGALQSDDARRKFLASNSSLLHSDVVDRLPPLVVERISVDAEQSLLLPE